MSGSGEHAFDMFSRLLIVFKQQQLHMAFLAS
jgi:hypothetical protein